VTSDDREPDDAIIDAAIPAEFADLAELLARAEAEGDPAPRSPIDPETLERRRRRRKRGWLAAGSALLVVTVASGSYVGVVLSAPVPTTTPVLAPLVVPAMPALDIELPGRGASAVSVTGAEEFAGTVGTDGILVSSGGTKPRPIASISKIITTLVILAAKPLDPGEAGPTITFTKADHDLYDEYYVRGATIEPMKTGSTMSLHDALELMLVVSASNYAEAVSTWAFGSQANFLAAARSWLEKKGLTGTRIVEPVGLDPRNTSTPSGLIALGRLAMANPVVASLVKLRSTDVPGFEGLPNTNTLLDTPGVNGIKTGTLDEAGSCLLFSAVIDVGATRPITIVGVVLDGLDHASATLDAAAIIDGIRGGFHPVQLTAEGDVVGSYTTAWGETADVVADRSAQLLTWSDSAISATSRARPVGVLSAGAGVGTATFTGEGGTVTVPLVLAEDIEGPDAWWRITHPAELFGG
jgi:D-alanyl-D-alanine carboxypeptidase (penicillin-binding protein 5/6)